MISYRTCIEIGYVLDEYTEEVIDRIFSVFDLGHLIRRQPKNPSPSRKVNILLEELRFTQSRGPFSDSIKMDLLEHIVQHFYRTFEEDEDFTSYDEKVIDHNDKFSIRFPALANSLKRDGYVIEGQRIKKSLPKEIEEAETENELASLLDKFKMDDSKGHLNQAISNHSQGNWAGANGQFRPFIESILLNIVKILLPQHKCESASAAMNLLSKTVNPPFLRSDLNEVESSTCTKPFVEGFWKRLHPEGTHPGLSDEEDSTFRYHISIVVALYLLKRLEKRK